MYTDRDTEEGMGLAVYTGSHGLKAHKLRRVLHYTQDLSLSKLFSHYLNTYVMGLRLL